MMESAHWKDGVDGWLRMNQDEESRALYDAQGIAAVRQIRLQRCGLRTLPANVVEELAKCATSLRVLDLAHNEIQSVPRQIGLLTSLTFFNLMANRIEELPPEIGELAQLENLGLKSNLLVRLPPTIGLLRQLKGLFLTDNRLVSLPDEICGLRALRKLQAADNRLERLPDKLAQCESLELVRLASNDIAELSPVIAHAPRLKWLTLSSNPLCASLSAGNEFAETLRARASTLTVVARSDVEIGDALGSGASGDVFIASLSKVWESGGPDGHERLCCKLFRAVVSPDGKKDDEIAVSACIDHPNITCVRALVRDIDSEIVGLIMNRIPDTTLADRPDFSSYLRSRWKADLGGFFSAACVLQVALQMADALQYLHEQLNVMHGDFYAHNIIFDRAASRAVLCDFGASFFYDRLATGGSTFETIEVKAYGLFLSELVERCLPAEKTLASMVGARRIADDAACAEQTNLTFRKIRMHLTNLL
ncbi:Leucine-rich repeat-containing protein 57 [Porphyridium purpureum]|uniref:Leucine-rich repeat-containing protein 57 n=1 Tax=Porphyridium purpureum TaxID=35688 RepID=A0A5J4YU74_PORPP|nr:Leucine-rich repeat-containing protein 57 [Porphyridium purpureum]|eukprot:POR8919..scf229_5